MTFSNLSCLFVHNTFGPKYSLDIFRLTISFTFTYFFFFSDDIFGLFFFQLISFFLYMIFWLDIFDFFLFFLLAFISYFLPFLWQHPSTKYFPFFFTNFQDTFWPSSSFSIIFYFFDQIIFFDFQWHDTKYVETFLDQIFFHFFSLYFLTKFLFNTFQPNMFFTFHFNILFFDQIFVHFLYIYIYIYWTANLLTDGCSGTFIFKWDTLGEFLESLLDGILKVNNHIICVITAFSLIVLS